MRLHPYLGEALKAGHQVVGGPHAVHVLPLELQGLFQLQEGMGGPLLPAGLPDDVLVLQSSLRGQFTTQNNHIWQQHPPPLRTLSSPHAVDILQ